MLHQPIREEFSDWPIELLAIGTFGNNSLNKDVGNLNHQPYHLEELTPEEVGELQKELKLLLCDSTSPDPAKGSTKDLEKFFDCLQSLEDDKENHLKQSNSIVCGKKQEVQLENTNSGISTKTLSYLLEKAFACRGRFTVPSPPLLRDPISQSKFEKLRLEKVCTLYQLLIKPYKRYVIFPPFHFIRLYLKELLLQYAKSILKTCISKRAIIFMWL